jgi:hypothetical protein
MRTHYSVKTCIERTMSAWVIVLSLLGSLSAQSSEAPCAVSSDTKLPFFGDLHIHTRYSFDSYLSNQKNDPDGAYEYAKGRVITLPNAYGDQTVSAQIDRPIDFAAVTDHGQFLGEVALCDSHWSQAAWWAPVCLMSRAQNLWIQLYAASLWTVSGGMEGKAPERGMVCALGDCEASALSVWGDIQAAAERHYDRSEDCSFTTFVGYEYTQGQEMANLHRNVIFRNEAVTARPISVFETESSVPELWRQLRTQCLDADGQCDVMAIPHNPNLGGGLMFPDPASEQEAIDRLEIEPLVELVQHKGASECRFDRLAGVGIDTEDELCAFEQIPSDNLAMLGSVNGKMWSDRGLPVDVTNFHRRNMMRNVLKDGLALEQASGVNPFKQGFIGSTDTHTATSGGAMEKNYVGHLGSRDATFRNLQDHFVSNPGGLAVVWAEENRRDAIFNAMRGRETYATSGTRPIVRFFAGDYETDLCDDPQALEKAYASGVPMGGILIRTPDDSAPRFFISAQRDHGTELHPANPLERIQIIKGWVRADGTTHERVVDVLGSETEGLGVDMNSCAATAAGHASLCSVWEDPDYSEGESAFYYARILETPSCRWSTLQCQAANVNPFSESCSTQADVANELANAQGNSGDLYGICCTNPERDPFYSPTIRERAWTSPIWLSKTR